MISLVAKNINLKKVDPAGCKTGKDLRSVIAITTGLNENRIRLTCPGAEGQKAQVIADEELAPLAQKGELKITVKDLGPQLGWRTVYFIEYLGPIVIHVLLYAYPSWFYRDVQPHLQLQKWFFWANFIHYVKREFETLFIHRFSLGTMPARNVFKNSFHYWILGGLIPAYCVYSPEKYAIEHPVLFGRNYVGWSHYQQVALWAIWAFCEWGNLNSHLILRNLRPSGSTRRAIPHGYGFEVVSCPNYFFEAVGWFLQCLIVNNWSLWLFWFVGSAQMGIWAQQKHRRYRKEFPDYPRERKAFIPHVW